MTTPKPKCKTCGLEFDTNQQLATHVRTTHKRKQFAAKMKKAHQQRRQAKVAAMGERLKSRTGRPVGLKDRAERKQWTAEQYALARQIIEDPRWHMRNGGRFIEGKEHNYRGDEFWTRDKAERLLGLKLFQSSQLFFVDNWPQPFKSQFYILDGQFDRTTSQKVRLRLRKKMAKVAARRITAFIKEHAAH